MIQGVGRKLDRGSFLGTGCPLWDERVCSVCLGGEGRCGAGGRTRRRDQARDQGLGKDTGSPCILELASRQPVGQPRLGGIISGGANPRAQPSRRSVQAASEEGAVRCVGVRVQLTPADFVGTQGSQGGSVRACRLPSLFRMDAPLHFTASLSAGSVSQVPLSPWAPVPAAVVAKPTSLCRQSMRPCYDVTYSCV